MIRVIDKEEMLTVTSNIIHRSRDVNAIVVIGGDRALCCDEAVIFEKDSVVVGIATISTEGESFDGTPTIVGVYVVKEHRGQDIGLQLLEAAICRMQVRQIQTLYRVETCTKSGARTVEKLPSEMKKLLTVIDCS